MEQNVLAVDVLTDDSLLSSSAETENQFFRRDGESITTSVLPPRRRGKGGTNRSLLAFNVLQHLVVDGIKNHLFKRRRPWRRSNTEEFGRAQSVQRGRDVSYDRIKFF